MKKLEQRVPNLRFKGFTDDWEQQKLGTLFQKNIERNDNEKFNYNQTLSVSTMTFKPTGNGAPAKSLANYKVLRLGDVAFEGHSNKQFSYGRFVVNDNADGIMSPRFATIRPIKAININYWKNYLHNENIMKYVLVKSTKAGTMMNELVYSDLYKQVLKVPNITEQVKIGNLLQKIEIIITLQQRKLDLLKQLKKGFLQKIFAEKNSKQPILRFKGFHDDWEQRKLGEAVEITMGQSPSSKNYTENPNDHILVQGNADMKNGYVVPRVWTTQITNQAEKGDLILSVRAPVGDIGKTDYDVVLGRGVAAIKGNSFIFQLLTKMKINGYWTRFSTGSTFESINSDNIKNAQISIPSLREQEKIGGLFNEFDSLIVLHQRKQNHLKLLKKSLLQQMFI